MPRFSDFHFDRLSFWLGFLAATLLWWLLSRVRPMLPIWRNQLAHYLKSLRQKDQAGMDGYLRRETIRRAQQMHLAAPIFALDEVLVPPRLIAPPPAIDPENRGMEQAAAARVIPYLPDWPELVAPFSVPTLTAAEALQNGSHIAIIGQPGSGKTVALAHLATQFGRQDTQLGPLASAVPVLLHALDLDPALPEKQDPLTNLTKALNQYASVVMQPQIPRFIKSVAASAAPGSTGDGEPKLILLLDGLDEITPARLDETMTYLNALMGRCPTMQVVVTASADYLDGLTRAGFYPLGVAGWKPSQCQEFIRRWGALWTEQLLPDIRKHSKSVVPEIDTRLISAWLSADAPIAGPLEWTLRAWSAYAGDLNGASLLSLLDTHAARCLPATSFMPAIETLAYQMALKPSVSLSYDEMEAILNAYHPPQPDLQPFTVDLDQQVLEESASDQMPVFDAEGMDLDKELLEAAVQPTNAAPEGDKNKDSKPARKGKKGAKELIAVSQGEQLITALLQGGVLVEHANHQIRFANPLFLGYLAGIHISAEEAAQMAQDTRWSVHVQALSFAATCADESDWILEFIDEPGEPVCRSLLMAARWLREAPASAEWRSAMMRRLVGLIQKETLPFGTRARLAGAFLLSRDASTAKLYKSLLASKSAAIRRLGLLGLGALGVDKATADVLPLLADTDRDVRTLALLTLAALPGEAPLKALVEVLLQGDEELRQAAAESLALNENEGHKILEEAAAVDDLLTRRAAVFGLLQVRQEWSRKLLEKISVADAQWVVRNAAAQALESASLPNPAVPRPLPPAADAAWLLSFAAKLGVGLAPDQPVTNVLLLALKSGSPDEQLTALQYLRTIPEEGVAGAIYHLVYGGTEELREPALNALWWMAWSGAPLPEPTQFGLG